MENPQQQQQDPYYANNRHRTIRGRTFGALGIAGIVAISSIVSEHPIAGGEIDNAIFVGSLFASAFSFPEMISLAIDTAVTTAKATKRLGSGILNAIKGQEQEVAPEVDIETGHHHRPLSPIREEGESITNFDTPDSSRSTGTGMATGDRTPASLSGATSIQLSPSGKDKSL